MNVSFIKIVLSNFRKNIILLSFIFVFFWLVIFAGKCLSVVNSRAPLASIQVIIDTVDNKKVNFDVVAKLARAGNNIQLIKTNNNTWGVNAVFVQRIAIAFNRDSISEIKDVNVLIDNNNFHYSNSELMSQWDRTTLESFGRVTMDDNAITLLSPYSLALTRSNIPIKKDFFSSIINWRGDQYLTNNTVIQAILPAAIISLLLYIFYSVVLVYAKTTLFAINDQDVKQKQRHFIVCHTTLLLTFVSEYLLIYMIKLFYHPNIFNLINQAKEIFLKEIIFSFNPKPVENLQYFLGVLFLPLILTISYYLSVRIVDQFLIGKLRIIYILLALATFLGLPAFIYLVLSIGDFFYVPAVAYPILGFSVYAFIIFPVFLYFLIKNKYQTWIFNILFALLILVISAVVVFSVSSPAGIFDANLLDAVYFPQTQIAHGKTIIQQVPSLYGLFPLILKPVFDIIGLGVVKFTFVMSFLVLISYLFILLFLRISLKNKIIPLLGMLSILNYFHLPRIITSVNYKINFQHLPVRVIFPSLILFISAKYSIKPNKYLYIIGHLLATLAIFWNFDSGIVVFISWNLFLLYLEIWKREDNKLINLLKSVCKRLLIGICSLLVGLSLLSLYYIYYSGSLPGLSLFFQYSKLFYSGFGMNRLPIFPHMWHLIILIYTLSLLISLVSLIKNKNNNKAPLYFILSILGFGLFIYFQGRALNTVLFDSSFVSILILALLLDDCLFNLQTIKKTDTYIIIYLCFTTCILLFILLLPSINLATNIKYFFDNTFQSYKELYYPVNQQINKNINFIKQNTVAGERILILTIPADANDANYYGETNTFCAFDFSSAVDFVFKYQYDRLLDFVSNTPHAKIFVNPDYHDERILEILNSKCKKFVSDTGMAMFVK